MNHPTLYQKTNTGAIQQWTISVEGATITTVHGQVGGKLQTTSDTIKEGKNIGQSNETTPETQAAREAAAKWTKQKKKGYVESLADAEAGKVDETVIKGGIEPMLAPSDIYPHYKKNLVFPVFTQPKFDGNRCIAVLTKGKCTLWTRARKPIFSVPHIVAAIEQHCAAFGDIILDGELYNHDYRDNFEDLMSLIRPPGPVEGHEVVQYHIYDMPSVPTGFRQRNEVLKSLYMGGDDSPLKRVVTKIAETDADIWKHHEANLEAEYEGTMIRNDGPYEEGRRSRHLQKLKTWKEGEYTIIGFSDGRGKDAGTVAKFICCMPDVPRNEWPEIVANILAGRNDLRGFGARLKASYDYRRKLYRSNGGGAVHDFIAKPLTVKFQNFTADNKPRFPIGKAIRDYE